MRKTSVKRRGAIIANRDSGNCCAWSRTGIDFGTCLVYFLVFVILGVKWPSGCSAPVASPNIRSYFISNCCFFRANFFSQHLRALFNSIFSGLVENPITAKI